MKRPIKYLSIKLLEFSSQEFFLKLEFLFLHYSTILFFKMIIDDIAYQQCV